MSNPTRQWWRLVRFGFRLLYNELAWTYDLVSWGVSLGKWRAWQRAVLPRLESRPGARVLEIAHGTGNLQIDLAAAGFDAIGIDLSAQMGRIARRKLQRRGIAPRLVRASGMHLPFRAQTFEAAVSTFPTEFIIAPETLHEVRRVLVPGGRFVIIFNGILTLGNLPARALEWLYRATGQRGPWPGNPLKAFEKAGFDANLITQELPGSAVLMVVAIRQ